VRELALGKVTVLVPALKVPPLRTKFVAAQNQLILSRIRLTHLERRSAQAQSTLANNLATSYREGTPDLVSMVVTAHGFSDMLEQIQYQERVSQQNSNVLSATRTARKQVGLQTAALQSRETTLRALAAGAASARDQANAVRTALLKREEAQLATRSGSKAKLANVQARIAKAERAQLQAAQSVANASTAAADAPKINVNSPGGDVVARVVAGANEIATMPYLWGGGHGSFSSAGGYDCSGSVSFALAAGGLLSSPLDSTGLESWGLPGPGSRITVYANAGHAYMYIDGRRFDTVALASGGTRWSSTQLSNAGFVARHPPGL